MTNNTLEVCAISLKKRSVQVVMKIKYFKSRADADRLLQIAFYRHFNVLTYRPFHLKN